MNEKKKDFDQIAATLEGVAAGLNILSQAFDGDDYQSINPKTVYLALCGYEQTLKSAIRDILDS